MTQLEGRVALITGAGSGIGAAAAKLLAKHGALVAAVGHTESELNATVEAITAAEGKARAFLADISKAEDMQRVATDIGKEWGRIDIVFANAGINGVWAPIEELEPEEFNKTLQINLTGTFLTIKYAVPYLKRQGGSIIVTASVNGTRIFSNTGATAYSASKAGQVALTKMLALELARDKVRVNVICPGAIETNIGQNTEQRNTEAVKIPVEYPEGAHPLRGAPGSADDVAELVLFLASDAARQISGTELWIDGAESLLRG